MEGIPKIRIIPMGIPAVPGGSSPALGASRDEAAADFSPFLVREDPKMPQERSRTPQNNARVSLSPTSSRMASIQGVTLTPPGPSRSGGAAGERNLTRL